MSKDDVVVGVIPQVILKFIKRVTVGERLPRMYVRWMRAINYAIIGGVGVIINMTFLHGLVAVFPLALANLGAILVAWTWNYTMSVGRLGYLWGFTNQEKEK